EDDVGHHIGAGIDTERIVGQPDDPQQVGPLGQILAGGGVLGIHRVPAGDKSHHAARTNLVQGLGKEIVVDRKSQLVVVFVVDLVVPERNISYSQIIKVLLLGGLKARHRDVCLRVQLSGNAATDGIQLYAIQAAALHRFRQHPEEVAYAAGGF